MNLIAFDMETESIPPDWDRREPLKVFCAAAHIRGEAETKRLEGNQMWYAGMLSEDNPQLASVDDLARGIENGDVALAGWMTQEEIEATFDQLLNLVSGYSFREAGLRLLGGKPAPVLWNGVGFDFPVLASNLPHRKEEIVDLCQRSVDPCFQFVQKLGFPIALKNIAENMLPDGRVMEMTGQEAALWPLDAPEILRYNANDPKLALDVMEAIVDENQVRWTTRAGKPSARSLREFKVGHGWGLVRGLIKLGDYDRSRWKDYDGAFDLKNTIGWMEV